MCRLGVMGSGHVPIVLLILMIVTLAITYCLAVYRHDVDPLFPYISSAGTKQPESCIFGQLLNIGSALGTVLCLFRPSWWLFQLPSSSTCATVS